MHKKSFTFGIGVGMLVMVAVFSLAYGITRDNWEKDMRRVEDNAQIQGLSEAEAIDYAASLGMSFATEALPSATPTPTATPTEPAASPPPMPTAEPTAAPIAEPTANPDAEVWVSFTIPQGLTATQACAILEREGVVPSAQELVTYLIDNGLTTKLSHGTFRAPAGCSYDELMTIHWPCR